MNSYRRWRRNGLTRNCLPAPIKKVKTLKERIREIAEGKRQDGKRDEDNQV